LTDDFKNESSVSSQDKMISITPTGIAREKYYREKYYREKYYREK
jgi:hypothetical protein